MKQLIATYKEAVNVSDKALHAVRDEFIALPLEQKLVLVLGEQGILFDSILLSDSYYSQSSISLYDDFSWDRYETKDLSDIIETVLENMADLTDDETPEELAALIMADGGDRCEVLKDMLNKNLGKATNDW